MGLLADLAKLAREVFTLSSEVARLRESLKELRAASGMQAVEINDLRERLTRLEAARDADRAQFKAELSRFMSEVERAEMRLLKPPVQNGGTSSE